MLRSDRVGFPRVQVSTQYYASLAFLQSVVGSLIHTHTASNTTTFFDLKERRCETVDLSSNRDFQLPSRANGTLISHLFFFFLPAFLFTSLVLRLLCLTQTCLRQGGRLVLGPLSPLGSPVFCLTVSSERSALALGYCPGSC